MAGADTHGGSGVKMAPFASFAAPRLKKVNPC
jgi:phytoene dehydrogenase-like protein